MTRRYLGTSTSVLVVCLLPACSEPPRSDGSAPGVRNAAVTATALRFTEEALARGLDRSREPAAAAAFPPSAAANQPYGSYLIDFDGDGLLDVYSINHGQQPHLSGLWLGTGAAFGLNLYTVAVSGYSLYRSAWMNPPLDLNADGRPDLYFLGWGGYGGYCPNQGVSTQNGWTGPTFPCSPAPYALTVADVNGDGRLDIEAYDPGTPFDPYLEGARLLPTGWYLNNGSVDPSSWAFVRDPFTFVGTAEPGALLDLNLDGLPDRIVGIPAAIADRGTFGIGTLGTTVSLGRLGGTYQVVSSGLEGVRDPVQVIEDVNEDGCPDVGFDATRYTRNPSWYLQNRGGGGACLATFRFVGRTGPELPFLPGFRRYVLDVDNSGTLDRVVLHNAKNGDGDGTAAGAHVFVKRADGTYVEISGHGMQPREDYFWMFHPGDWNGDGLLDLVGQDLAQPNTDHGILLYTNQTITTNRWLKVQLPTVQGAFAQPATIEIYAAGRAGDPSALVTPPRTVRAGRHWPSMRYHFGLGDNDAVDVRVRFPDGSLVTRAGMAARQTIAVMPGAPGDTTPPTAPTGLAATAIGSSRIDLSWNAASDNVAVVGYRLERCAGAACTAFALLSSPSGTSYGDSTVLPAMSYRYRVRAVDGAGNAGGYSTIVDVTTASASDLIAAFGLSEASGSSTADASGNGNTGALVNGPVRTAGRYGGGLGFDGIDDHVTVPAGPALDFVSPFTVMIWVQNQDPAHSWERILNRKAVWNAPNGWEITLADPRSALGGIAILGSGGTTAILPCVSDWRTLQLNQWVHVAVVFQAGGVVTLYCDGVREGTATIEPVLGNSRPLLLGRTDSEPDKHWRGLLDEVYLYRRALSQAEIQSHMNTPVGNPSVDITPPTAPTGLLATAGGSRRVDLSWNAASDNVAVVAYRLERCTGAACSDFTLLASPGGTSYSDSGVLPLFSYRYRVRAVDAAGNAGGYSGIGAVSLPALPNLVAAFGLNESAGPSTADASGNGNTGTLVNGPLRIAGRHGGALSFDGIDDYVSVPAVPALDFVAPFTAMLWVQNQDPAHSWERILNRKAVWNALDGWEITLADPRSALGSIAILGSGGTTAILPCVSDWRTLQLNQWVHVAVVFEAGGVVTLYCDGAREGTGTIATVLGNSRPLLLGRTDAEPDKHWRGLLDEVYVYRRALSQAEIQSHLSTPLP